MKDVSVLLVDDHPLLRDGIKKVFSSRDGFSIVGEAENGSEAVTKVGELSPEIVIMDITMKGMDGIETTGKICKDFPATKVIILSMHEEAIYAVNAFKAGARAYVVKTSAAVDILQAVDAVLSGKRFASHSVSNELLSNYVDKVLSSEGVVEPIDTLTRREKEILNYIADGMTSREIAGKLFISLATVKSHRINLMRKLDVHDVAGLVRFVLRNGIL